MAKTLNLGLKGVLALSAVLLLAGGLTVYAAFDLTGTGQVVVTPPTITAKFVSGHIGNQACQVTNSGSGLSCPSVSVQAGNTTTLVFSIQNTGTQKINMGITVTPDNSTVLLINQDVGSPSILAPGSMGTYTYTLYCENVGDAGFAISVTPLALPVQA